MGNGHGFRHAPLCIQFSADVFCAPGLGNRFEIHVLGGKDHLQIVDLIGGQVFHPLLNAHVLDLLGSGLLGTGSLGFLGFGVGHRQFSLDLVPTVEEVTEPVDRGNVAFLLVVMGTVFRHADDQADGHGATGLGGILVVHSGGNAALVAQFLDGRMVYELSQGNLTLDKADKPSVNSEGVVLPFGLGEGGRTLGGGGLGVGIHGVPLSLA